MSNSVSKILILALCLFLTIACNKKELKNASGSGSGFSVFEAEVYPLLADNCATCHGPTGFSVEWLKASSQETYAYLLEGAYVDQNFRNAAVDSTLAENGERTGGGHQACFGCGGNFTNNILPSLKAWYEAESADGGGSEGITGPHTANIPIPAGLPNPDALINPADPNDYAPMTWSLSSLGSDFAGASFSIEIQKRADGYKVRRPRLFTGNASLRIRRVRLVVNGAIDPLVNDYNGTDDKDAVNTVVAANQRVTLSSLPATVIDPNGPGLSDTLGFAFEQLEVEAVPVCNANSLTAFTQQISPIINNAPLGRCLDCHGGANLGAQGAFPMTGIDAAADCSSWKQRISAFDPIESPFARYPVGQSGDIHPIRINGSANILDYLAAVQTWLDTDP